MDTFDQFQRTAGVGFLKSTIDLLGVIALFRKVEMGKGN